MPPCTYCKRPVPQKLGPCHVNSVQAVLCTDSAAGAPYSLIPLHLDYAWAYTV